MMAAALLAVFLAEAAAHAVPLPQSRPAEAPKIAEGPAAEPAAPNAAEAAPAPSACRIALTEEIALAPSIPPINGPGGCGGDDLVRLEAVVLRDKGRVAVKPAAILRCTMAAAVADWVRTDMAPLATDLGTSLSDLDNFDSFECRGRNRVAGAKLSEHGHANALDVRALKFTNGQSLSLTDRSVARDLREKVLASVCSRFTTVLGPGSDWYHEDHIHLDLAERRSGYRICQWNVYDLLPAVAPVLPADRPDEAPARETADGRTTDKPSASSSGPSQQQPEDRKGEAEQAPQHQATGEHCRRHNGRVPIGRPEGGMKAAYSQKHPRAR